MEPFTLEIRVEPKSFDRFQVDIHTDVEDFLCSAEVCGTEELLSTVEDALYTLVGE